jgi:polysaccharide export outer membrane protein
MAPRILNNLGLTLGLTLAALVTSTCGPSPTRDFNYKALQDRCKGSFRLEAGDVVTVNVWNEPNHSREQVLVRPDGKLSLPLINDINASGLTIQELKAVVTRKVKTFVPNPRVYVSLRTARSYQIYVMGEVRRSGTFTPRSQVNVLQALALAGGVTPFAKRAEIKVIWKSPRGERRIPFNYEEVANGTRTRQNLTLCRGDTVLVP